MKFVEKEIYGDPEGKVRTFAIISTDNPFGESNSLGDNLTERKKMKKLLGRDPKGLDDEEWTDIVKRTLESDHYQYTQVVGQFGVPEHSFFIYNIPLVDTKVISNLFKQQSFIWGRKTEKGVDVFYYETMTYSGPESYVEKDKSLGIDLKENEIDNFTRKNGFKFSFRFPSFEGYDPCPDPVSFEESMNERYTPKTRMLFRGKAYHRGDKE